jgi:hypothetical protein
MASGFLTPDGPLAISGEMAETHHALKDLVGSTSFEMLEIGQNKDGFWTGAHLISQLEREMIKFECLYPDKQALFLFDNSSNHHNKPPDGLDAWSLTLKNGGGGKKKRAPRDGWYLADGIQVKQPMVMENGDMKGLKTILEERGLWSADLTLASARTLLASRPDFAGAKSWLVERVEARGHLLCFYL